MYNDNQTNYWEVYRSGTDNNDGWYDDVGGQTYDGKDGFDHISYPGALSDYTLTRMDDGGIMMSHAEFGTDAHYGIEAIWFEGENAGYAMEDALNLVGTNQPTGHGGNGHGDGYGGGGGDGYYSGTEGDDSWDDESGNQTYNGGNGFDYVGYSGTINDYSLYRLDDGGITMTSYDGSTDVHYGIEGLWFYGDNAGYAMEDALNWGNDNGGGDDGYGGGGGNGYYAGTYGDDVWDDYAGNQTYDGGDGYDQVNYQGGANHYSATRLEDGGVQMSHYDGSADILYGIDGLWFNDEQAWYSMDDMVEDYSDEAYY